LNPADIADRRRIDSWSFSAQIPRYLPEIFFNPADIADRRRIDSWSFSAQIAELISGAFCANPRNLREKRIL